jgi:hypothetical protein
MSSNQYDDGEQEAADAQDRINRILNGGAAQDAPQQGGVSDDPLGGAPRVELRSRAARSALGLDQQGIDQPQQRRRSGGQAPAGKARQAIMVIGGVLVLGVLVVVVLFVAASMANRGGGAPISLPFFSTATPTSTATPLPTSTPTPTATVPPLSLPNLDCLVQSTTGCLDYCQNIDNLKLCDQARIQAEAEGVDFTVFLKCLEPAPGPNTGNPQTCLEAGYRAKNP